jgi:hypothetical protein
MPQASVLTDTEFDLIKTNTKATRRADRSRSHHAVDAVCARTE